MPFVITKATEKDHDAITNLWEASVRATHHFLPEADIIYLKPLVRDEFLKAVDIYCTFDEQAITGFTGIANGKIEMLFVHPSYIGKGMGKALLRFAVEKLGATKVDVNEQNEQAVGFYLQQGFVITGMSPLDGMGKPYPLLHMEIKKTAE